MRNCKIKLSDKCRDNFFRTANCGMGIDEPEKIKNVHVIGEGRAILEGADHPRASGDGSKILANPCPFEEEDVLKYAGDNDELYFRDYLIEHLERAKEYEELKLKLWKQFEHNRDDYTNAKTEFVKKYTEKAKVLYGNRY